MLVLTAGSNFKKHMVNMIVISFLTTECFNVVIARETIKSDLEESDCANNALYRFDYHFMFFAMFLCPTTNYLVFWFVPIYAIKYNMVTLGTDIDIWFRVSQVLAVVLNVFILFYIVTWRELTRYFQQQALLKRESVLVAREEQLTGVLNLQSDAIILINEDFFKNGLEDALLHNSIEFYNTKSREIFNFGGEEESIQDCMKKKRCV